MSRKMTQLDTAREVSKLDDVPTFGSQVEDFAGLDVTDAEAKKLTEPTNGRERQS